MAKLVRSPRRGRQELKLYALHVKKPSPQGSWGEWLCALHADPSTAQSGANTASTAHDCRLTFTINTKKRTNVSHLRCHKPCTQKEKGLCVSN